MRLRVRLEVRLRATRAARSTRTTRAAREPAATKGDASGGRTIVVVLQRSNLMLHCGVGLIVRLIAGAVMRRIVRFRVVLEVWLRVILEVRFRVRLVVGLGVRLEVRLRVRLEMRLSVRLEVTRRWSPAVTRRSMVLGATEGNEAMAMRTWVDILMFQLDRMVVLVVLLDVSVGLNVSRSAETLSTIVARGAANGGATCVRRPEALPEGPWRSVEASGRRTSRTTVAATRGSIELRGRVHNGNRVDMLVLDIDGMIILVDILDLGVENTSHRHIKALSLIIA